ncbi:iron chelate uptake ABC transporter family permease subunit [Halopseudomonas pelagia]|uniref:iron chelate uptake ABC transporter family permease subunit n=1 Tax=Halopseudomonas pelagia TaxID=553151 RepID=UPI00048DA065|nr:iron chelate uptake ABC transporter family permease subunit [Halopseudomonas pelagia]|tara:strand:+ start:1362 stop:2330 length:969 start_codon:yes stop_codon:yes gene_type:complete
MSWVLLVVLLTLVLGLAIWSLNVGASRMNLLNALGADPDDRLSKILFASRLPRTLALMLAGAGLAVAGLILQMMARNRLVEPSTVGTMEAAALGMLMLAWLVPGATLALRFAVVSLFALGGTLLFLAVLQRIPLRSALIVPLVGLVLVGVVAAGSGLLAQQLDLAQALRAWSSGDFSAVLRGRYELLWVAAGLTLAAMLAADRFAVIGMGKDFATNVGVNYGLLIGLGLLLVAMISASVVVVAGVIPFVGLIAPNLVRWVCGDQLRRSIPLVALLGAALLLAADIAGRLLIHPFEVPSSSLLAIVGCLAFLFILFQGRRQWV